MERKFVFILFLAAVVLVSGCAQPDNVNPVQKISALGKPGTVLIYTDISGTVELPYVGLDPDTGLLVPLEQTYTRDVNTGFTGSGFIISSDGYAITNAHVVSFSDEVIKNELLSADVQAEVADFEAQGTSFPEESMAALQTYVFRYGEVSNAKVTRNVLMGVPVAGAGILVKSHLADLRKAGEASPGKDIAIIKMDGTNFPTVKLGDSDEMQVGDSIYALGYPGVATFHPYISEESVTEPSLTSGIVSAEKQMTGGFKVLQIDAAITHGNSGGPVFNKDGEVIGIATFGSIDFSTWPWQEIQGFNFIMPINLAKEFMNEINVENKRGAADTHYELGMTKYWNGDYNGAIGEFQIVKNLFPGHPYVDDYIRAAQEKSLGASGKFLNGV